MTGPAEFGPYIVYEELGTGAMASVHRAETRGTAGFRKAIALKRLHPQLAANEELVQAFVQEARLASYLKHGNIVQTFDFGKVDSTYFIAMELARGPTLKQVIRQCVSAAGAMPLPIAIGVVIQICDALDHAHNVTDDAGKPLGIVHRDVSPSNVIIDSSGVVKLIDFGIAKVKSRSVQTQAGTIKGKFGYIAPEYLAGQIDARADLFAVGVLTHELLTSRQLFTAENEWETLTKIREMPIQPPSRWNPQVPMELDHIVLTALQRDPSLRWQNAAALRNALGGVLKDVNEVVTDKRVADWVMWAFSQRPRNDDSAMVRLIDDLEPSVSVEIVRESSSPIARRDTPGGKTVELVSKPPVVEPAPASKPPVFDGTIELVPASKTPVFDGTVELVPAAQPTAAGDAPALFPGLIAPRASGSTQPIPMQPMPKPPGETEAPPPSGDPASSRRPASTKMPAQPGPASTKMPAQSPPAMPTSSRVPAQPGPPSTKMLVQSSEQPGPTRPAVPLGSVSARLAAEEDIASSRSPGRPEPSSDTPRPGPSSSRMPAPPGPASSRMPAQAEPGVVMAMHASPSSGVVLDKKLPVKRPFAPRRRRARWWLIAVLVVVAGGATAGYFQFPQLRAWWAERMP